MRHNFKKTIILFEEHEKFSDLSEKKWKFSYEFELGKKVNWTNEKNPEPDQLYTLMYSAVVRIPLDIFHICSIFEFPNLVNFQHQYHFFHQPMGPPNKQSVSYKKVYEITINKTRHNKNMLESCSNLPAHSCKTLRRDANRKGWTWTRPNESNSSLPSPYFHNWPLKSVTQTSDEDVWTSVTFSGLNWN